VLSAGIPVLATLPFLLAEPHATSEIFRYRGIAGVGGLSLLLQPDLGLHWLHGTVVSNSGLTNTLQDLTGPILVLPLLAVGAILLVRRPAPAVGAALIVLTLWVFGVNYFLQYAVWGLPFFLLAGWWRAAALLQAVYLIPLAFRYIPPVFKTDPASSTLVSVGYIPVMIALWLSWAAALVWLLRTVSAAPASRPAWLTRSPAR
jgi:hypothetical protein